MGRLTKRNGWSNRRTQSTRMQQDLRRSGAGGHRGGVREGQIKDAITRGAKTKKPPLGNRERGPRGRRCIGSCTERRSSVRGWMRRRELQCTGPTR